MVIDLVFSELEFVITQLTQMTGIAEVTTPTVRVNYKGTGLEGENNETA